MEEKIEVLYSAVDYIQKLYPATMNCAEKLQKGELSEAYEEIGLISEGLDWLINVLVLTKELHHIEAVELKEIVSELIEALQNEDTVLISDLLKYEIGDKIEEWYEILIGILKDESKN